MTHRMIWGLVVLLPLAACGTVNPTAAPVAAGPAASVPGASTQDQTFVAEASGIDRFEIRSSRLAVQKARRPAVRAYAQRLIDGHTATTQRLGALVSGKGGTLPAGPDPAAERMVAELDGAGSGFDAAYVAAQLDSHKRALATYQTEVSRGSDPALKAFAQATLPELQGHLEAAQRLHGGR